MTGRLPHDYFVETLTEAKRSRFICTLARVDSEGEARAVIASTRAKYPDARHHCSAFIVEVHNAQPIERSNDDGEPAGTAGMPMLESLRSAGLSQVVAVVTRYFGGVLLGTGGLVRAYSDAVAAAVADAPRVRLETRAMFCVTVDHASAGRVHSELVSRGCEVTAEYGEVAHLTCCVADPESFPGWVAELTNGQVTPEPAGYVSKEILEDRL